MRHSTRALAAFLVALPLAAGCTSASYQRTSQAQPQAQTPAPAPPLGVLTAIPGHRPVTATGVVEAYNQTTRHLMFKDGRVVELTNETTVSGPGDPRAFEPGSTVAVDNVLPVGVLTTMPGPGGQVRIADTRLSQHMATVTAVDPATGIMQLSDGSIVRVTPATRMHMGATGPTIVLRDVQPGDEIVFVLVNSGAAPGQAPSALPQQAVPQQVVPQQVVPQPVPSGVPADAGEIMIFRVPAR